PATFTPPSQTTNLEVTFEDRTGLASTRAELLDPSGAVVRVLVDETLRSPLPSRTTRVAFDGIAAGGTGYLPPGVYTIRASATDVRDHTVTATGTFTMLERVVTPGTRRADADGGCACTAGRVGGAPRGWWLVAALGLAGVARRRRRGSAGR
ncbi:MAG: hypothetical protein KA978_32875, partial [Deltaproteobacteria bacterium]|nr:hypothetical protein [Deltaproteobacteria bacterium]